MNLVKISFVFSVLFLLSACSDEDQVNSHAIATEKVTKINIERHVDVQAFSRGQKLYLKNCSICHGKNAEGNKNWRKSGDDGKYPAPPLNGTAHTWHHSTTVLVNTIKNGTAKIGGNMPAWKDKLTDTDIRDILTWVKAQWSDEIYTVWYKNDSQEK